jgi:hypothetical protein
MIKGPGNKTVKKLSALRSCRLLLVASRLPLRNQFHKHTTSFEIHVAGIITTGA